MGHISKNSNETRTGIGCGLFHGFIVSGLKNLGDRWRERPFGRSQSKWFRKAIDESIRLLLLWGITCLIVAGLVYFFKILWYLYIETPVGRTFLNHYGSVATPIFELFELNISYFSLVLCLMAVKACLSISAVCQLLSIARFFYLPRGFLGRLFFWGTVCCALTAFGLSSKLPLDWRTAFVFGFIPTLFLTRPCFSVTMHVLPELYSVAKLLNAENRGRLLNWFQSKKTFKVAAKN